MRTKAVLLSLLMATFSLAGCTGECATNPNATASDPRDGRGAVYYLASGPSLYVANGEMQPLY